MMRLRGRAARPRPAMSAQHDPTLVRTKLHRPPVAEDAVPRPLLLERLEQGRKHPLTLVSTPAGYGKSTLLSSWLAGVPCRTAWVSLGEEDGDPRVFLSYVVAALEGAFPDACSHTRTLLGAADLPPTRVLAGSLVNELDALTEPLILVLDDYHLVRSSAVHDLVSTLIAQGELSGQEQRRRGDLDCYHCATNPGRTQTNKGPLPGLRCPPNPRPLLCLGAPGCPRTPPRNELRICRSEVRILWGAPSLRRLVLRPIS